MDSTLGAPAAPALKAVRARYVRKKSFWRPYISDSGAQRSGPMAKPTTNMETPRMATSEETLKSTRTSPMPPEKAELAKETDRVAKAWTRVMNHLREREKVMGLYWSSGRNSTR